MMDRRDQQVRQLELLAARVLVTPLNREYYYEECRYQYVKTEGRLRTIYQIDINLNGSSSPSERKNPLRLKDLIVHLIFLPTSLHSPSLIIQIDKIIIKIFLCTVLYCTVLYLFKL